MSDLASLLAQMGTRPEPAADSALAAVRLARATIDALILKLGQNVDARVTAQLAAGLTQLSAGGESFVLKLETPLPVGTPVTIRATPGPAGRPVVVVTPHTTAPAPAAPLPVPAPQPPVVGLPPAPQTPGPQTQPQVQVSLPRPPSAIVPQLPPQAQPAAQSTVASARPEAPPPLPHAPIVLKAPATRPAPQVPAPPPVPVPTLPPATAPAAPLAVSASAQSPAVAPAALPPQSAVATVPGAAAVPVPSAGAATPPPQLPPQSAAPQLQAPRTVVAPPPAVHSSPAMPAAPSAPTLAAPFAPPPPAPSTLPAGQAHAPAPAGIAPIAGQPPPPAPAPVAVPVHAASPTPPRPPIATGLPTPLPAPPQHSTAPPAASSVATRPAASLRPAQLPLQQVLADPVQAVARQASVAPLVAHAAAILRQPAAAALPIPVLEALARVVAGRVDLNRAPPDGRSLREAALRAGTLEAGPRQPGDIRTTLLALRTTLQAFLGGKVDAVAPVVHSPPPPIPGEPPRATQAVPGAALQDQSADETARQLLGHADGALARTKLLQLASSPPEARPLQAQAAAPELRFEIPMLLGAETGILQLVVERDGRHKANPRERGWRMRFAMSFSATGEVGADVALLGRAANVSIWAAEPATADALEAMLPELAPALAQHGLDVAGLRVRRGVPQRRPQAPGQLLDSAR